MAGEDCIVGNECDEIPLLQFPADMHLVPHERNMLFKHFLIEVLVEQCIIGNFRKYTDYDASCRFTKNLPACSRQTDFESHLQFTFVKTHGCPLQNFLAGAVDQYFDIFTVRFSSILLLLNAFSKCTRQKI